MSERKLNTKQINTLLIVYRFRYVTTNNLARHKKITHNSAYSALEILVKNGYLGRKHNKNYRLLNKPASYFLLPQAVRFLGKSELDIDADVLASRLREKTKSAEFIDQQVAIHAAYLDIEQDLSVGAQIMTATELAAIEGVIKPLPSLYVEPEKDNHYFVELTDGQHLFIVKKRIRKYIEHYESDEWEWDTYPNVRIVRKSKVDRSKLIDYVEEKMDDSYLDDEDIKIIVSN